MSALAARLITQFNRLPPREQKIILFKLGAWVEFAQERAYHYVYPRIKRYISKRGSATRPPISKHRFFHRDSGNFIDRRRRRFRRRL
jgi:hypothetical protein